MIEKIGNCLVENNVAVGFCDEFEEHLVIPEGVVAISERAFQKYYGLVTIEFPSTLQRIGEMAFFKCSNLRKITLPEHLSELQVDRYIDAGTFQECKQLIEADLSKTKISILPDGTFWGCKKLQKVSLPPSLIKIKSHSFFDCSNLVALELNEGLKVIECDFSHHKHLSVLNIPRSVIHIEDLSRQEQIKTVLLSKEQHENFREYLPPKCSIYYKE